MPILSTNQLLHWSTLTGVVEEIKPDQRFIQTLVFSTHRSVPTQTIEISIEIDGREMAPFVTRNGEAVQVSGVSDRFITVEAPHIRIKRVMHPSDRLSKRAGGSPIFNGKAAIARAARQDVRRQMAKLQRLRVNRIEWLCCMALRGQISYTNPDLANFTITFQKPAGHTIVLAGTDLWTDVLSNPRNDFREAGRLIADEHGLSISVAIFGREAATAFLNNVVVQKQLDNRNFAESDSINGVANFTRQGTQFLGFFAGIPCFEYSRVIEGEDLIRSKFVEFIHVGPDSENVLYFAAIEDEDALDQDRWVGEVFAKSWVQKDPSVRIALLASNPLPVMRRPGSIVSIQVVA